MQFNIALIGAAQTGKTTWISRLITGEFIKDYIATTNSNNHFVFKENTTQGLLTFNVTELNSATDNMEIFDAVIVMFSVLSKASFNDAKTTIQYLQTCYPTLPIVLCGNQVDRTAQYNRMVTMNAIRQTNFVINRNYFDISARTNYHFDHPFLFLGRRLTNDNNLQVIEHDPIEPPTIDFDESAGSIVY